jgi:hypothetical protein
MKKIFITIAAFLQFVPGMATRALPFAQDGWEYRASLIGAFNASYCGFNGDESLLRDKIADEGGRLQLAGLLESNKHSGQAQSLYVPAGLGTLNHLKYLEDVERVTFEFGSRLRSIEPNTFLCSQLVSICLPSSMERLGAHCFEHCYKLSDVRFEFGCRLTLLEDSTFSDCSSLKAICIPSKVQRLCQFCFAHCFNLEIVTFESGSELRSIDNQAFLYCLSLAKIDIPRSVETIGTQCFMRCDKLQIVNFMPDSQLTSILDGAFSACCSLGVMNLPSRLERLGEHCFELDRNLSLVTFGLGSQLASLGPSSFLGCVSLADVDVPESKLALISEHFNRPAHRVYPTPAIWGIKDKAKS